MSRRALNELCTAALCAAVCLMGPATTADAASAAKAEFVDRKARLAAIGDPAGSVKSLREQVFGAGFEPGDPECVSDADADGLPDCVETATGIFIDETDTGTDPGQSDTDGDGLSDGDEVLGTLDGLDLPALGVSPLRRDLLVEYDWFDDASECAAHSHAPSNAVLDRVAAVFADAPLVNPDGSHGIHLIQDAGQGGARSGGNRVEHFDPVLPGAFDEHYREIKQANFASERRGYFRYVLMPHRYAGGSSSSGFAEVIGDDIIVSLYCQHSDDNVARTIIHELGHNLGLRHGGFEACNGKPNYNSVMNYRYQFSGQDGSCDAAGDQSGDGFSSGARLPLDENALDEFSGVCGDPPIDWNRDGLLQAELSKDLNPGHDAECGTSLSRLEDFDDWNNLSLIGIRQSPELKSLQHEVACAGAPLD